MQHSSGDTLVTSLDKSLEGFARLEFQAVIAGTAAASELSCTGRTNRIKTFDGHGTAIGNVLHGIFAVTSQRHSSRSFSEALRQSGGRTSSVFTASAWRDQVFFGAGRRDRARRSRSGASQLRSSRSTELSARDWWNACKSFVTAT